ncbi:ABC transporter permease [Nocardia altamirensis]|uniref:ABC transporter permease n=1 Tax=Nocardia altamirensis TaxID=472158 RepID=UPI00083FFE29|nr:ABC transporter permease [Nocardia altamirensis]
MASIAARGEADVRTRRDQPTIWDVTLTELARMRRGFIGWYVILLPFIITVPLYPMSITSPEGRAGRTWTVFRDVSLEAWGVLIPMTAALLAALSVRADQDAWRLLFSYAVPRSRYLVGKYLALAVLSAVSTALLAALLCGGAALTGRLSGSLPTILAASVLPWLAGLGCAALALLIAVMWGLGPTIAVGVLGMMSGMLISDKSWWMTVPFAWPMRVILPLAGIGPNGVPLPADSPVRDRGVILPAIALSLVLAALVLAVGAMHLKRKEI